jgi:hypothetical protein
MFLKNVAVDPQFTVSQPRTLHSEQDEQFCVAFAHNPHLMTTSVQSKKSHSLRDALNWDFSVLSWN